MPTDEQREDLGALIEERMLRLGLTQAALAAKAGVSVPTVRKIQRGYDGGVDRVTVHRVASALGWDPVELYRRISGEEPAAPLEVAESPAASRHRDFNSRVARLSERDQRLIDRMIDELLGEDA